MITYTTCRRCGGLLHTTDSANVHPSCKPKPTKVELLTQQWLDAVESGDEKREKELSLQIEAIDTRPPRLLDAAFAYANWGWPVFPLKPQDKKPATRNGFKDATTDTAQIFAWWTKRSDYNIGLPTGHAFDVIDIDVPDGAASLTMLIDTGLIAAVHGQVATSSGGLHLYVKPTGGGNGARLMPGIDYRGEGGYVVAPPSTLGRRGRSWAWITQPSPAITGAGETFGASV